MSPARSEAPGESAPAAPAAPAGARDAFTLFAMLWGAAAVFHVLGPSGRAFGVLSVPSALGVSQALLCLAGLWLIARPRLVPPLIAVAVLGLITAWLEAPLLGNHWLLAAYVNLAILIALALSSSGGKLDEERLHRTLLPVARLCLLIFYSFAAFAKLNPAFFDTRVSCSTFFFDETARSFGLSTPIAVGAGGWAGLIPVASAAIELSVPVLLFARRTRILGVMLGLVFHSAIALDRIHLFIDFSSVLAALFVLFLPASFAGGAVGYLNGRGRHLKTAWLAVAAVVLAAQWKGGSMLLGAVFLQGRLVLWYLTDAALVIGIGCWALRNRRLARPPDRALALPREGRWAMALVPALVLVNGFFPYLELRTGFSYTMYSNLRMVDGRSNHFLIRSSLPVAGRQEDLVTVLATDDPGLVYYVGTGYQIPWDSFRAYLQKNPAAAVSYQRAGRRRETGPGLPPDPARRNPPPLLVQKLLPLRAVDVRSPPRCQDVYLPAL